MRRTLGLAALTLMTLAPHAAAQGKPAPSAEPVWDGRPLDSWIEDLAGLAPITRSNAAFAITEIAIDVTGPAAAPAVPALIEALKDPYAAVRYRVAFALGAIGPAASAAIPALTEALDDNNDDVAFIAKKALKKIGAAVK